ncbi:hypothetical protein HPSNT_01315 [Helicobacter pylori SNT49]|uniref:Uncharacterized protein n=1 Tax=Helicobacter pylori SNT49 TaxID=1055530 RepID=G2MD79_HELPX|nr:hypothetical protein HPSNT_01315 [Helicobacter pylori SNT49]
MDNLLQSLSSCKIKVIKNPIFAIIKEKFLKIITLF